MSLSRIQVHSTFCRVWNRSWYKPRGWSATTYLLGPWCVFVLFPNLIHEREHEKHLQSHHFSINPKQVVLKPTALQHLKPNASKSSATLYTGSTACQMKLLSFFNSRQRRQNYHREISSAVPSSPISLPLPFFRQWPRPGDFILFKLRPIQIRSTQFNITKCAASRKLHYQVTACCLGSPEYLSAPVSIT